MVHNFTSYLGPRHWDPRETARIPKGELATAPETKTWKSIARGVESLEW